MRIEDKRQPKGTMYKNIALGQVIRWHNIVYLKMQVGIADLATGSCYTVNCPAPEEIVTHLPNAKLVIEE